MKSSIKSALRALLATAAIAGVSAENSQRALALREAGKLAEARQVLQANAGLLNAAAIRYKSAELRALAVANNVQLSQLPNKL